MVLFTLLRQSTSSGSQPWKAIRSKCFSIRLGASLKDGGSRATKSTNRLSRNGTRISNPWHEVHLNVLVKIICIYGPMFFIHLISGTYRSPDQQEKLSLSFRQLLNYYTFIQCHKIKIQCYCENANRSQRNTSYWCKSFNRRTSSPCNASALGARCMYVYEPKSSTSEKLI